jgi:hypothetical protein
MKTMYVFLLLAAAAGAACAQAPIGVDGMLPPALRNRPPEAAPATGAALRAQALAKLEKQFRAADLDGNGSLTADEAKHFGFVARHFDEIDAARRGAISFDDLRAYLVRMKAERR